MGLLDQLTSVEDLDSLSDEQLGKIFAPSSEKMGFFGKLGNALAGRRGLGGEIFGTDAEGVGRQVRANLLAREAMATFDQQRQEAAQNKDILATFDLNGDGTISFNELPRSEQDKRRAEGQAPQKEQQVEALGPTRPLFTDMIRGDRGEGFVEDELGTGSTLSSTKGLNPDVEAMIAGGQPGSDRLSDLLVNNTISDVQGLADPLLRQLDPGLQATQVVEDPEGVIPQPVARQAFESLQTDLRTPKSQPKADISPEQADEYLATLESAAGVPIGTVKRPNTPLAPSQLTSLGSSVSSIINNRADNLAKEQRQKEYNAKQKEMFDLKATLSRELQDNRQQFSLGSAIALKGIGFENQQRLDEGRASRKEAFAREQAKSKFENQLELFEKKSQTSANEGQLNRDAALLRTIVSGSQKIQAQDLAQIDRVALADHEGGIDRFQKHLDTYYNMVKAYPAITGDLAEILASVPPGTIPPATEDAIRGALAKEANETFGNRSVENTLEAVTAGVWGVSAENKALALWTQSRLGKRAGIDTTLLDEALKYLDAKPGGQTININTGMPKTAGEREDITGFRNILTNIDYIANLYDSSYTGFVDNLEAKGKSFFGLTGQREEMFRASVAEIKSTIAKMRAGGAIGPAEERFLLDAIPDIGIPDSQFVARLANFQRITQNTLGERYSLLGFNAKTRADELEAMGKYTPADIERILIREGLLGPREKKGKK